MVAESSLEARERQKSGLKRGNMVNVSAGRPKGLAQLVREKTKDGKDLVEVMMKIAFGDLVIEKTTTGKDGIDRTYSVPPSHRDVIEATQWLADRGFGKAVELHADLTPSDDFKSMAKEFARQILEGEDSGQSVSSELASTVNVQEIMEIEGSNSGLQPVEPTKTDNQSGS